MNLIRRSISLFFSCSLFLFFSLNSANAAVVRLEVESIKTSPTEPRMGIESTITVTIKNASGDDLTDINILKNYDLDFENFKLLGVTLPDVSLEKPLEFKKTTSYKISGKFTELGEARLSFGGVGGSGSINTDIEVVPSEDISVTSIILSPENPAARQPAVITVEVKNNGEKDLASGKGFLVFQNNFNDFDVSGDKHPNISSSNRLGVGEVAEYIFEGNFRTPGEKVLSFTVNSDEGLLENNLENNTKLVDVEVSEPDALDLSIQSIKIFEGIEVINELVKVMVKVENTGNISIVSTEGLIGAGDVKFETENFDHDSFEMDMIPSSEEPLEPGDVIHYTYIGRFKGAGEKSLYFGIDNSEKLDEENRDNNATTTIFTIYEDLEDLNHFEINNIELTSLSATTTAVSWDTSKSVACELQYKESEERNFENFGIKYGLEWPESSARLDGHAVEIKNLKPGSKYDFKILCDEGDYEQSKEGVIELSFVSEDISEEADSVETSRGTSQSVEETEESLQEAKESAEPIKITNKSLYNNLNGKIILKVESAGEAYYVNPQSETMHYLGRPDDAFSVMRSQGVGISNLALSKIPIGFADLSGPDTDGDGLTDAFEDALGTDKTQKDSDGDNFSDKDELMMEYNPLGAGSLTLDKDFARKQAGKIFLQVEAHGEAWYLNPGDNKRYFLGRPGDAFSVMRKLGLGISNTNFDSL